MISSELMTWGDDSRSSMLSFFDAGGETVAAVRDQLLSQMRRHVVHDLHVHFSLLQQRQNLLLVIQQLLAAPFLGLEIRPDTFPSL